jgi:predicted AlkP superfamily pyrophosphatase or phosphodiesterase
MPIECDRAPSARGPMRIRVAIARRLRTCGSALLALTGVSVAAAAFGPATSPDVTPAPPALVVVMSVDQMRGDYVDRHRHQWTRGLKRLLERGAVFAQAAYPYMNTVTCAGHATIGTGTWPATHGMVLNEWWDRKTATRVWCTDDPSVSNIGHGGSATGGDSAAHLRVPTLADELRAQSAVAPHIVSVSLKARAAITLAGRRGDLIAWIARSGRDGWATSTAFAPDRVPFLDRFVAEHPIDADRGKVWARTLPDGAYAFDDDGLGERRTGWTATFPHALAGAGDETGRFYDQWVASPFADEYLGRLALAAAEHFTLGRGRGTDFLAVSFSALDSIGHSFGPRSHEVQDTLVRLDATIGDLLDGLDRLVGLDRYVVALTGDHGVAPIPEQMAELGVAAGRISTSDLAAQVDAALVPHLGPGPHVAALIYTELYFRPGVHDRLLANPVAMRAVVDTLERAPGIDRVIDGRDLESGSIAPDDRLARAAARGYAPGRSGDLLVIPRPYWISGTSVTTHGTAYLYDARVPVILAGPGVRPGTYLEAASPADIAPTLAHLVGITLPSPDGRVLREALLGIRAETDQPK